MKGSIWFTFGVVGFGYDGDCLFPQARLGLIAVGWCRGALRQHIDIYRQQACAALRSLGL